jgi:hypothetical protein
LTLAPPIWKRLVGETLTRSDLPLFDVATSKILAFLRDPDLHLDVFEASFPDVFFSCLNDQQETVDLIPHGRDRRVSFEDRLEYANVLEQWKLTQFDKAIACIKDGISSIVHAELLAMFTWQELEVRCFERTDIYIYIYIRP